MLAMSTAQVAVVIPVYRALYLHECLASVFAQTQPPDQVIVIDDGSPDRELLERATAPYRERLTLVHQPNAGAGAARNRGVLLAGAELIAFLDADDIWHQHFLQKQLHRLEATPDCTLVYSNARLIGDGPLSGGLFMDMAPSHGCVTVEALLSQECSVLTSSVVTRRAALLESGLFDVRLRRGQDFDMWVRIAHRYPHFAYTTEPLVTRRIHACNLSGDTISELERALLVLTKLAAKLPFTEPEQRALQRRTEVLASQLDVEYGKRSLATGHIADARERFKRAAEGRSGWKVRAVSSALRVAPGLVRRMYLLKTRRQAASLETTAPP